MSHVPAMKKRRRLLLLAGPAVLFVIAFVAFGDTISRRVGEIDFKTAREADESDAPTWPVNPAFKKDAFTFARIKYSVDGTHGLGKTEHRWAIDFPASDLDLSFRLQQMTSMKVDPDGRVLKITDKELFDFPFLYIVEPGRLTFTEEELPILRKYLLNGGFLMFDDFWGEREWASFHVEIKRLFPDREPVDLSESHPIFHTVFNLTEKPQVPGLPSALAGRTHDKGEDAAEVHYRGISDDKGRLMVLICHNTDLGDGWEREGFNEDYFRDYSEKKAFPMGINIIVYAMTH